MAAGFWNKTKSGLSKAWNGVKKVAAPLVKNVIAPAVKKLAPVLPGGAFISRAADFAADNIERVAGPGSEGANRFLKGIGGYVDQGAGALSSRIQRRNQ